MYDNGYKRKRIGIRINGSQEDLQWARKKLSESFIIDRDDGPYPNSKDPGWRWYITVIRTVKRGEK